MASQPIPGTRATAVRDRDDDHEASRTGAPPAIDFAGIALAGDTAVCAGASIDHLQLSVKARRSSLVRWSCSLFHRQHCSSGTACAGVREGSSLPASDGDGWRALIIGIDLETKTRPPSLVSVESGVPEGLAHATR